MAIKEFHAKPDLKGGLRLGPVVSGGNLSADQNDWAPSTEWTAGKAGFQSFNGSGLYRLTGLDATGFANGDIVSIIPSATEPIMIMGNSTSSLAANRIGLPGNASSMLWYPGQTLHLHKYTQWQVIGISGNPNPKEWPEMFDDFLAGSTETGEVGQLGWAFTSGSVAYQSVAAATEHGLIRRTSGTVAATVAHMTPVLTTAAGLFRWDGFLMADFRLALVATNADFGIRFGISADGASATPTHGAYIERLAADTSFFGVSRNGGAQTRTAALLAQGTTFNKFTVIRLSATVVRFIINDGAPVDLTPGANIPDAADLMIPFLQITPTTTTARSFDIDYFQLRNRRVSGRV